MKWFKHISTSTSDPDLMESEVRFKSAGPYVFWRTLEILAREDAIEKPLVINLKVLKTFFPSTSAKTLTKVLQYFDKKSRIFSKIEGENISIFCDKLSEISSDYNSKVRSNSRKKTDSVRKISVLELEEELELEKEEENKKNIKREKTKNPTVSDIENYCRERGNSVSPEKFYDYYSANGWRVGKNPMRDWKAAVRTWEKNSYDRSSNVNQNFLYGEALV